VNFEEYLRSKKIDSPLFREAEPGLWETWRSEFDQMHPNSFTIHKLNLINPIRRKYQLKVELPAPPPPQVVEHVTESVNPNAESTKPEEIVPKPAAKPAMSKPVFKPKPKIN
jgi:hypothetical protein